MESTHSDDQMFAALDEKIRAEAEAKMQAIRLVAVCTPNADETREEFAAQDAKNVSALDSALAEARKAGFRESDLAQWKSADKERNPPADHPRTAVHGKVFAHYFAGRLLIADRPAERFCSELVRATGGSVRRSFARRTRRKGIVAFSGGPVVQRSTLW
ncbi:hypothetical protein GS891_28065 [Rhodococcus hoagii]|nr:hypothetical protein [Prescottella equi]